MARDTIVDRLRARAQARPNDPALYTKRGGSWSATTWAAYDARVRAFAKGLIALGHPEGRPIAILGANSEEWCVAALSAMALGGAAAGVYTTCSPEEVHYILEHSEAYAVVVENGRRWREQVQPIRDRLHLLAHVILIEPDPEAEAEADPAAGLTSFAAVEARGREDGDDALAARVDALAEDGLGTLIYTSGTTGPPKAVMLSHRALSWTSQKAAEALGLGPADAVLSYLPLSHIAEQMFTVHGPVTAGIQVYFAESLERLKDNLVEVRPTLFFGVPRVWEKLYDALREKMSQASGVKAWLLAFARSAGRAAAPARQQGARMGFWLQKRHALAERLIFSKVKAALGFDRLRVAVSGAAPIARDVLEFFQSLDITIHEVYGQSEGSGPTTFNTPGQVRFGTVGRPFPGVDVKLAPDGEVLVRGPNIFLGYLKNPEATAEVLRDGWLYSGDVGVFDADGYLQITDRKKDLIITAGGKNIAPQNLEGMLKEHPLIGQAVVIGDRRRFIASLVTLAREAALAWAEKSGRDPDPAALAKDPELHKELQRHIDAVNARLASVEQIKRFTVLPAELTIEAGELTPTMKVKRKVVHERHKDAIEAMYG